MNVLFVLFAFVSLSLSLQVTSGERSIVPIRAPNSGTPIPKARALIYSGALFDRQDCGGTCGKMFFVFVKLIQAHLLVALAAPNAVPILEIVSLVHLKDLFVVVVVYAMEMTFVVEVGLVVVVLAPSVAMGDVVHRNILNSESVCFVLLSASTKCVIRARVSPSRCEELNSYTKRYVIDLHIKCVPAYQLLRIIIRRLNKRRQ